MSRKFTSASSEKIVFGIGALNFAFGPGSIAGVMRTPTSFAAAGLFAGGTSGAGYSVNILAAGTIQLVCDATARAGSTALTANTWYLVATTKATGTVTPRIHFVNLATGTTVHESASGTLANSSIAATRAAIGTNLAGTGNFFNSDISAVGVWNSVLTDSQIESLALDLSEENWNGYVTMKGHWKLDQSSVGIAVKDLTGNGADQTAITGTSVTVDELALMLPSVRSKVASPSWAA